MRTRITLVAAVVSAMVATIMPTAEATTGPAAVEASVARPTYTTISTQYAADPGFARFGANYYVYATSGTNAAGQSDGLLPIFRGASTTRPFALVGNAYKSPPKGFNQYLWAPHVVQRDGRYFMFFAGQQTQNKQHCVYWSVASSPTGPFGTPHLVVCGDATATTWEAIDPTVYRTATGADYVVWKRGTYTGSGFPHGDFYILARRINFRGASVGWASGSHTMTLAAALDTTVMEAPSVIAHGGRVSLFVSRDRYDSNAYRTEVWSAKRFGPGFRPVGTLMQTGQGYGYGPGGAEVINDHGTTRIAWHVWTASKAPGPGGVRVTRVATLTWPGGRPHVA